MREFPLTITAPTKREFLDDIQQEPRQSTWVCACTRQKAAAARGGRGLLKRCLLPSTHGPPIDIIYTPAAFADTFGKVYNAVRVYSRSVCVCELRMATTTPLRTPLALMFLTLGHFDVLLMLHAALFLLYILLDFLYNSFLFRGLVEKFGFRNALHCNRCEMLADGYYG